MSRKIERITQTKYKNLIGCNIKKLRQEKNIKATDIIRALQLKGVNISTGTYYKIEQGLNNPSVEFLICLVEIMDTDFNTLFTLPIEKVDIE